MKRAVDKQSPARILFPLILLNQWTPVFKQSATFDVSGSEITQR